MQQEIARQESLKLLNSLTDVYFRTITLETILTVNWREKRLRSGWIDQEIWLITTFS